ncbi:MAG: LPS translocon maturation chaperone LptM [Burkholderiaceae bacterium]
MKNLKTNSARVIAACLCAVILVGCGQKGPLTLPKPQFPAPPEEPGPAR